jgi:hypothetical protein
MSVGLHQGVIYSGCKPHLSVIVSLKLGYKLQLYYSCIVSVELL